MEANERWQQYVRQRLARTICTRYRDPDHRLHVVTLDPALDFQFLMFNAVAISYVLIRFCIYPGDGLPEVPAVLAGITSISALTYTANKAVVSSTPLISGVSPLSVAADEEVLISGSRLGGTDAQVLLDDQFALVIDPDTATATGLRVKIPKHTDAGAHTLTVSVLSSTHTLQAKVAFMVID